MKFTPLANLRLFRRRILHFYLTEAGRMMICCALLSAMLTLALPIYVIFACFACLLLCVFFVGIVFRPRLLITGELPDKAVAGSGVVARFHLTNRSRLPAYDLSMGFIDRHPSFRQLSEDQHITRLGPGQSTTFDFRFEPLRRGSYELPQPRVFSTFPFNLYRQGRSVKKTKNILVLPDFSPIRKLDIVMDPRYQPGGVTFASNVGESPEYLGNREFRSGDSPRKIDTRAWARLLTPIVKEYQEEYYCHIALVLDTFVLHRHKAKSQGYPEFEAAVSLTAAVADFLSRDERIIDFFAAGPELYVFRSGRNIAHFENLLDILACVEHCHSNPFEIIAPALESELGKTSSVIFVLLDWDSHRERLLRRAVEAGCCVRVLIVRGGPTSHSFHQAQSLTGPFTCLTGEMIRSGKLQRL